MYHLQYQSVSHLFYFQATLLFPLVEIAHRSSESQVTITVHRIENMMARFSSRFQNDIFEVCHAVVEVSDLKGIVRPAILVAVFGREFERAARRLSEVREHFLVAPSGIPLARPIVEVLSITQDVYHPVDARTSANGFTFRPYATFVSHTQADTLLLLELSRVGKMIEKLIKLFKFEQVVDTFPYSK